MVLSGRNVYSSQHERFKSTKNARNINQHNAHSIINGIKDLVAFDHDNILCNMAVVDASCSKLQSLRPRNSGNKALAIAFPNSTPHWSKLEIPQSTPCTNIRCSCNATSAPRDRGDKSSNKKNVEGRLPGKNRWSLHSKIAESNFYNKDIFKEIFILTILGIFVGFGLGYAMFRYIIYVVAKGRVSLGLQKNWKKKLIQKVL